jgi:hypothetical protein
MTGGVVLGHLQQPGSGKDKVRLSRGRRSPMMRIQKLVSQKVRQLQQLSLRKQKETYLAIHKVKIEW